jgi:hypothetical protein
MKKYLAVLIASLSLFVTACGGATQGDSSSSSDVSSANYEMNEDAAAGDYVHKVTFAEKLAVIPASSTIPDFSSIAEDLAAAEGFTWVHLKGQTTNNALESDSVDSTNIAVVDSEGRKYSLSTDVTKYVESDVFPTYIEVQPSQTVQWEAYFQVPVDASGLKFYGNDLSFLPEFEVYVDLGL